MPPRWIMSDAAVAELDVNRKRQGDPVECAEDAPHQLTMAESPTAVVSKAPIECKQ